MRRSLGTALGAGLPERQWTTEHVPVAVQFELWQEAVDQAFVPVAVQRKGRGRFVGEVSTHRLGGIEAAGIAAPAQAVRRTVGQLERDAGDVYFLNLPLSPGASVTQDQRTAHLTPGDFAVVDSARPFELDFDRSFRQISLKLPRDLLHTRLVDPSLATGMRVVGDRGVGAVASAAIQAAVSSASSLDGRASRSVGEQLADLVALALGGVYRQPATRSGTLLFEAALDEIDRRLAEPDLSPAVVAERIAISTRYLHRLFSERGTSFGRCVLTRRLELAYRDLTDLSRAYRTVSQIARERGFADPSYFTRAFKSRYGVTPSRLRALTLDLARSALSS